MSQKRRFSAQPKTIQRDLRKVVNAMSATSLKISQDIFEGTAEIVFDRSGQRYVFRCHKYEDAMDNLRAAQLTITYLWRALEEYGVTSETQTLRRVRFPHTPVIFTASEVEELRALLQRWSAQGSSKRKEAKQEEA